MADDTTELVTRIRSLTREEVMEAALTLGEELDTGEEPQGEARSFITAVEAAPLQHIEETEELARVLLIAAAADQELAPTVRRILEAIGAKAFILGGLEIVALAGLAVAALHIVISKRRTSDKKTATVKFGPDGNVSEIVFGEEQAYGISSNIGGIVTVAAGTAPAG